MADGKAGALALTVATPLGMALNLSTDSVQLPGVAGEFGVLPDHIPLLAALKPGVVRYRDGGATHIAAIGAGFSEVGADHVRVITEFFLKPEEIKLDQARADLQDAEGRLKNVVLGEPDQVDAQNAYDWALARIEVAGSGGTAH